MILHCEMQTIGIRDLKARLSHILREVQRGETVLVTDRGRVVAELRAPGSTAKLDTPVERAAAEMAGRGELRLAEPTPNPYQVSPLASAAGTSARLLAAERADR